MTEIPNLPSETAHALGSGRRRLDPAGTAAHLTVLARDANDIADVLAKQAAAERERLERAAPTSWRLREVAANERAAEKCRALAAEASTRAARLNAAT